MLLVANLVFHNTYFLAELSSLTDLQVDFYSLLLFVLFNKSTQEIFNNSYIEILICNCC